MGVWGRSPRAGSKGQSPWRMGRVGAAGAKLLGAPADHPVPLPVRNRTLRPHDTPVPRTPKPMRRPRTSLSHGNTQRDQQRHHDEHEQPLPQQPRIRRPPPGPRGPRPRPPGTTTRRRTTPAPRPGGVTPRRSRPGRAGPGRHPTPARRTTTTPGRRRGTPRRRRPLSPLRPPLTLSGPLLLRITVGEPPGRPIRLGGPRRGRPHIGQPLSLTRGDLLEPQRQLKRAGPLLGILGEASADKRRERIRHPVQLSLLMHHAVQHHLGTTVPEGRVGGRGVGKRGPEREHIGSRRNGSPPHLLRREKPGRPDSRTDMGERRRPGSPGDTEVDDPRPLGGEQDVRRLEIAMDNPGLMHSHKPLGQRGPDGGDLGRTERPLVGDLVMQGRPGHVLSGEPRPISLKIRRDEPSGAPPTNPPSGRDLAREPRTELLVLRQIRPDHLQRDPLPLAVGAQIDDTHSARAEPSVKPERADDARVLAPQAHHRHVHPRCPVRVTSDSLRFHGRPRAKAAPSRTDGLSVPGGKLEEWSEALRAAGLRTASNPNQPSQKGD